jgi:uncharacterized protein YndB with AHSA1/START domain
MQSSAITERELILTRVFNAPCALVFKAWTDPVQLAQWWGPTGFTNPVCELDLKPYGEIRIDMRAPDGTVYPMSGAFREIVEPERLVFTSAALDQGGKPMFENLNIITFEEFESGKTLLTVKASVLWATPDAEKYLAGMSMGWSLTIDRLSDFVTGGQTEPSDASNRELKTTRAFKAPRDLVFRMWTEAEHIAQWWGPNGFTTTIEKMDVRPGGEWIFVMRGPDGRDFLNRDVYGEVVPPERLVILHLNWPTHRMYVNFTEVAGETTVSVRMLFESAVDLDKVVTEFGAAKGLTENLERLGQHLTQL